MAHGVCLLTCARLEKSCGKHRVAALMRTNKIKALRGYKAPRTIKGRPSIIASNHLNRAFTVDAPNKAWVTDITYIRTWQGWLYLAVVLDLYARKVVGWSMKPTLGRELALDGCSWRYGAVNPKTESSCIRIRGANMAAMTGNVFVWPTTSSRV